ncbi:MAG: hypothetical protein K2J77_06225 [Oscillospiraceae bacterium]|nr:hypothetical protein [Oscillospiraceae bacterium]
MKTVIAYESKDQQSVLKLVKAIDERFSVTLIDVTETRSANLSEYELIGFASEIEDDGFYRDIASFAANWMPRDKKIFFLYTAPTEKPDYCEELEGTAHFKNCEVVGKYGCMGQEGLSGFRLFGNKNKNHPNEEEIEGALKFFEEVSRQVPNNKSKKDDKKDKKPEDKNTEAKKDDKDKKDKK